MRRTRRPAQRPRPRAPGRRRRRRPRRRRAAGTWRWPPRPRPAAAWARSWRGSRRRAACTGRQHTPARSGGGGVKGLGGCMRAHLSHLRLRRGSGLQSLAAPGGPAHGCRHAEPAALWPITRSAPRARAPASTSPSWRRCRPSCARRCCTRTAPSCPPQSLRRRRRRRRRRARTCLQRLRLPPPTAPGRRLQVWRPCPAQSCVRPYSARGCCCRRRAGRRGRACAAPVCFRDLLGRCCEARASAGGRGGRSRGGGRRSAGGSAGAGGGGGLGRGRGDGRHRPGVPGRAAAGDAGGGAGAAAPGPPPSRGRRAARGRARGAAGPGQGM